jgi:hypothetical protein
MAITVRRRDAVHRLPCPPAEPALRQDDRARTHRVMYDTVCVFRVQPATGHDQGGFSSDHSCSIFPGRLIGRRARRPGIDVSFPDHVALIAGSGARRGSNPRGRRAGKSGSASTVSDRAPCWDPRTVATYTLGSTRTSAATLRCGAGCARSSRSRGGRRSATRCRPCCSASGLLFAGPSSGSSSAAGSSSSDSEAICGTGSRPGRRLVAYCSGSSAMRAATGSSCCWPRTTRARTLATAPERRDRARAGEAPAMAAAPPGARRR